MFKKTALTAAIALAISTTALADYQFEADGAYSLTTIDVGKDDGDVHSFGIGGSFFLNSVDTSKGPLSEAAFLDHASSVSAYYVYTDPDTLVEDLDGDEFGIGGRYVLDLDSVPLIFEGAWSQLSPEFSDIDIYSIGFGAYVTDTTTVVLSYSTSDVDEDGPANIDAGDIDAYELAVEHLWELPDGAIKLEGSYGLVNVDDADDIDSFNVAGTWYINDNLGFGTGYRRFDNFGVEADDFSAHAEWFISEQVGLSLAISHTEVDDTDNNDTDVDVDSIVLGARVRF